MSEPATTRINKRLADLGLCSRREADTLIEKGVVLVNGKIAVIGQRVSNSDKIEVNYDTKADKAYIAYYKGRGIITHSPALNEVDIASRLKKDYGLENIYPIGRLDKDSEGLMILSNDGRLTRPLLDSKNNIPKIYEVEVDKSVTASFLNKLAKGVNIEGYQTKPTTTKAKSNKRFLLTLTEGKKHQIRRMCAALGYQIQSLKRVQVANIELDKLKPNQYRKLTKTEIAKLFAILHVK